MDLLEYINLAVNHKNHYSPLTSIYRDTNHLVGSDGSILIYSNSPLELEPHYLDGRKKGKYPNWKEILPKSNFDFIEINSNMYRDNILPFLKASLKLYGKYSLVEFKNNNGKLEISAKNQSNTAREKYKLIYQSEIYIISDRIKFEPILLSTNYLMLALKPLSLKKKLFTARILREESTLKPIQFDIKGNFKASTILMPVH